jgi:hypothetical protein
MIPEESKLCLQALLEGISLSQLQPKIPPKLIKLYLYSVLHFCIINDT